MRITAALALMLVSQPALAACPIELATYRDRDGIAELNFAPVAERAAVTNMFKLLLPGGVELEGMVMWTENPSRSNGIVMRNCPEGDVTGDELAACTIWQGVIYAIDSHGAVDLMSGEGKPAPQSLLLADLGYQMVGAPELDDVALPSLPWDAFTLSGCQE